MLLCGLVLAGGPGCESTWNSDDDDAVGDDDASGDDDTGGDDDTSDDDTGGDDDTGDDDVTARPIYWWVGNAVSRMDIETADLVTGFAIHYDGDFVPEYETRNGYRLVGSFEDVYYTIEAMQEQYAQGARRLSTDLENWYGGSTYEEAVDFTAAIDAMPGLEVIQWQSWMTWPEEALPVLESCEGLVLAEMIYPTANGDETYEACLDRILSYLSHYEQHLPAIGLSIYANHDCDQAVDWELMKAQIDAARDAGETLGSPAHPIAIFWGDLSPDFSEDDVNEYIAYSEAVEQRR